MKSNSRLGASTTWLCVIALLFLLLRVPVMYRQPGGQDEDYYAVPGLAVLRTGTPRMPHIPARNPESAFYGADEALFCEPPLYFYYQALFYALLPDVYGTARLASGMAGLLMVYLVYRLSLVTAATVAGALWAAGLFSFSRWFYFPATCARPDVLCGLFGLAAVLCVFRWQRSRRLRSLILAGVCIGLGGLTHPFAIVYAVQLAGWVFLVSRGWRRLGRPALLAATALLIFSLWLPLIATHPEIFRIQFRNQFGGQAGGSLWHRALLAGPSLVYHGQRLWEHIGPIQMLLAAGGLISSTIAAGRTRNAGLGTVCWLAWSSIYLMSVAVGPHHQVFGYWIYPAGLMFVCVGHAIEQWVNFAAFRGQTEGPPSDTGPRRQIVLVVAVTVLLLILLVPGSGLRTLAVHLRHWNDIDYDSPRFARRLISSLPPDDVYAVDTQFTLDFIAANRKTLLANTLPVYFRVDLFNFDTLIVSRYGLDTQIAKRLAVKFVRSEGIKDDLFACYAEIYEISEPRRSSESAREPE